MMRQWSQGEKWLFIGTGIFCLPLLVGSWIYERQNELPPPPSQDVEVPPANNAFDVLMQAAALMPRRPTTRYIGNVCKGSNIDREYTCDGTYNQPPPYTPQYNVAFPPNRKTSYLKSAQNSLNLWRSSISLPLYMPADVSASQFRRDGEYFRELAFVQARYCWQSGDTNSALSWLLLCHRDLYRTTRTFFNGRFHAVESNPGWNLNRAKVLDELERLMPYLNAVQLQRAALAIGRDRALLPPRVEAAKRAKEKDMARVYRACVANDVSLLHNPAREWPQGTAWPLRFRWANKKRGIELIGRQWDWIIQQAEKSNSASLASQEAPPELRVSANDPFIFAEPYWNFGYSPSDEAREIVLTTAMAVRSFALLHGSKPPALKELVPRYLQKIENDPYRPTQQLRYLPQPKTYTVWYRDKLSYAKRLPAGFVAFAPRELGLVIGGKPGPTGYHVGSQLRRLPFLLYSIGRDGYDDGGMDFKGTNAKPASLGKPIRIIDDVLAPADWFTVTPRASDIPIPGLALAVP